MAFLGSTSRPSSSPSAAARPRDDGSGSASPWPHPEATMGAEVPPRPTASPALRPQVTAMPSVVPPCVHIKRKKNDGISRRRRVRPARPASPAASTDGCAGAAPPAPSVGRAADRLRHRPPPPPRGPSAGSAAPLRRHRRVAPQRGPSASSSAHLCLLLRPRRRPPLVATQPVSAARPTRRVAPRQRRPACARLYDRAGALPPLSPSRALAPPPYHWPHTCGHLDRRQRGATAIVPRRTSSSSHDPATGTPAPSVSQGIQSLRLPRNRSAPHIASLAAPATTSSNMLVHRVPLAGVFGSRPGRSCLARQAILATGNRNRTPGLAAWARSCLGGKNQTGACLPYLPLPLTQLRI